MTRSSSDGVKLGSMGVPKSVLETEGRKKFRKIMYFSGMLFFWLTLLTTISLLLFLWEPNLKPEMVIGMKASSVVIPMFLLNLMGMFLTSGSDGGGTNWFARAILIMFGFLGPGFVIISLINDI